ncbi:T9SS type A sorting domain-containing protein [Hymenobacter artigasi]|uniref:T9SS type A sorting domain-containing protein n=1 Tax=Hymenobacter artigasi TaxID=2719616 RepID=A0ABX1HNQ8_9BACT|nr:T9SS type A sorting domain-containing protein [Hymenobacter artigasi]NKI91887.1 hypothetical protein [Hymenobacter artigasi]
MRSLIFCVALLFSLAHRSIAQSSPTWLWSQQIGGTGDDYPGAVATDIIGNTVATGYFEGTVQLGTTSLSCQTGSTRNIYVAKYDGAGALLWARRAGDAGPGNGYTATSLNITTDNAGNVYVVGDYTGTITFGTITLTGNNFGINAFLVKYSASGIPVWAKTISSQTGSDNHAVAVDANENVIVAGTYSGTASFGALSLTSLSTVNTDAFLAKYDNQGIIQWARSLGGSSDDDVAGIRLDSQGNVFVAGSFASYLTLGGQSIVSNGLYDAFLAKYDAQGILAWANNYGGAGDDFATAVAVDAIGNAWLGGVFNATASFGIALSLVSQGNTDGFVLKCNGAGNATWVHRIGGIGYDEVGSLTTGLNGDVYALSSFEGTITLGSQTLISAGSGDVVLERLSTMGNTAWAVRGGGVGYEVARGVAYGVNGRLSLTVGFGNTTQFGPFASSSRGKFDTVVLQIQDNALLGSKQSQALNWQAYPNPFSRQLTVDVSQLSRSVEVCLKDAVGREVLRQSIPVSTGQKECVLPIGDNLTSGIYWLQLITEGHVIETKRLIKLP